MTNYTSVVSVRLPSDVLEALRARAKRDGRSVSGSITRLIGESVADAVASKKASRRLMGMFAHLDAPASLVEWQAGRRQVSRRLTERSAAPRGPRAAR